MRRDIPKLIAGLVAMVGFSGCGNELFKVAEDKDEHDVQVRNGANYTMAGGTRRAESFRLIEEVRNEEEALNAFFKAKELISKGYFSYDDSEARGNYAQAADLFEKSLGFYIPDLKAMTLGKNPVHQSANWDFLRGLHEEWAKASVLAGRTVCTDRIEENSKDAWALRVLYGMSVGKDETERGKLIAERFNEVKQGLVYQLEKTETPLILNRPVSQRISAEITYDLLPMKNNFDELVRVNGKGESLSRTYDVRAENFRKNNSLNEAKREERIRANANLIRPSFLAGDPVSGRTYSVKVGN